MEKDLLFLSIIFIAIVIGYFLGWRKANKSSLNLLNWPMKKMYFQGLNYLLNEKTDKAVDAFIDSLDVNDETLETHLALGKLMRKQGQVDRAIKIHQNLLARPSLHIEYQHRAHLELGRDFLAAGLLDRAELLLQEVIAESTTLKGMAQRYLMDIYQDEREWESAIDIAESLLNNKYMKTNHDKRRDLVQCIAQFYCELALKSASVEESKKAKVYLEKALSVDKSCTRASILLAQHENKAGRAKQAIKLLSKVSVNNPSRFSECLPSLYNAYLLSDEKKGLQQFIDHVFKALETYPSTYTMLFAIDRMLEHEEKGESSGFDAQLILSDYLQQHPSLAGVNRLIDLRLSTIENNSEESLQDLQHLVTQLLAKRMIYKCSSCGFAGRQLHWRCPGCKGWDKVERIKGIDAD